MTRKFYSEEVKRHVVARYQGGETVRELSARFGPTPTTIYKWLQAERESKLQAMSGDVVELKRLQAELEELKMQNAFLKRAAAWFASENEAAAGNKRRMR